MKLGISPINWCNDDDPNLGREISFEQCLQEMQEAGYVATEVGSKYPRDPQILKQHLKRNKLQITSAWFSTYFTEPDKYESTISQFLDHLSFMRALGANFINICECGHAIQQTSHGIFSDKKPVFSTHQWQALIQGLHHIGRIAHDFNMTLVYHYHAGTGVFNYKEIAYLMHHTSPTLLSLLLDTGHAAFADIDSLQIINDFSDRIAYVHLKDIRQPILATAKKQNWNFMDAVRAGIFTVPGDGDISFPEILVALKKHQYEGWMIVEAEQDPAKAIPLIYAKKAYEYIKRISA